MGLFTSVKLTMYLSVHNQSTHFLYVARYLPLLKGWRNAHTTKEQTTLKKKIGLVLNSASHHLQEPLGFSVITNNEGRKKTTESILLIHMSYASLLHQVKTPVSLYSHDQVFIALAALFSEDYLIS